MTKSGDHLGTVRRWMQRTYLNGDRVTWGSWEEWLQPDRTFCPADFENLAQEIRDAVLKEFGIKDHDHEYRFLVCCDTGPAFQDADTAHEIWNCLFSAGGETIIFKRIKLDDTHEDLRVLFHGSADKTRAWIIGEGRQVIDGQVEK